jgi:hypothetical protein
LRHTVASPDAEYLADAVPPDQGGLVVDDLAWCRVLPAQGVVSAQCRGLDEKPGTFTYSRFTCDILVGYGGRFRGRIAVWPTGPTTLCWKLI